MGPKKYETDLNVYVIEEFLNDYTVFERNSRFDGEILDKLSDSFIIYNELYDIRNLSNTESYVNSHSNRINKDNFQQSSNSDNNEYLHSDSDSNFDFLTKILNDNEENIIRLTIKKVFPIAKERFENVKNQLKEQNKNHFTKEFSLINYIFNNLETLFRAFLPHPSIPLVFSHNDAHFLNVMIKSDKSKVILIDHEFACYNFPGFDFINYLIETQFLLTAEDFPFYLFEDRSKDLIEGEYYFSLYLNFLEKYFKSDFFEKIENFNEIKEILKTKEYYLKMIGVSTLYIACYLPIYYNPEANETKNDYNYIGFGYDRAIILFRLLEAFNIKIF